MNFLAVFFNRHGDLRIIWRILLFLTVLFGIGSIFVLPLQLAGLSKSVADYVSPAVALVAILLASFVLVRYVNKKPFGAIGLWFNGRALREIGFGCLAGFLMMAGIFLTMYISGFTSTSFTPVGVWDALSVVGGAIIFFALGAAVEEALFRGYLFQTLVQGISFFPAVLLMAMLFAVAHLGNPNISVFGFINIALASIWLSIAYLKTRGLWLPFGIHFGWNFSQTTIFGFPTSGLEFAQYRFIETSVVGPEWMTGGVFGPEGGILATLALLACTWYILKSGSLSAEEGVVTLDTIEDLLEPEFTPPLHQEPDGNT